MAGPESFPVAMNSADGKDVVVRRATTLMAFILALVWLPVTMHCALEALPGLEFLICCAQEGATPHEDGDCGTDACAVLESGFYKVQDHDDFIIGLGDIALCNELVPPSAPVSVWGGSDRKSSASWRFFCRAAGFPRAPSLIG